MVQNGQISKLVLQMLVKTAEIRQQYERRICYHFHEDLLGPDMLYGKVVQACNARGRQHGNHLELQKSVNHLSSPKLSLESSEMDQKFAVTNSGPKNFGSSAKITRLKNLKSSFLQFRSFPGIFSRKLSNQTRLVESSRRNVVFQKTFTVWPQVMRNKFFKKSLVNILGLNR